LLTPEAEVLVISGSTLRALDEVVGSRNPFELRLRGMITTTDVRMIDFRTIAERRSDRPIIGIGSNTENIIDRFHGTPVPTLGGHYSRWNPPK
jgi:hypothetical protein